MFCGLCIICIFGLRVVSVMSTGNNDGFSAAGRLDTPAPQYPGGLVNHSREVRQRRGPERREGRCHDCPLPSPGAHTVQVGHWLAVRGTGAAGSGCTDLHTGEAANRILMI